MLDEASALSQDGNYAKAVQKLSEVETTLRPYASLSPVVATVQETWGRAGALLAEVQPFVDIPKLAATTLEDAERDPGPDLLEYRDLLVRRVEALNAIPAIVREKYSDELSRATRAVEKKLKAIHRPVAIAEKKRAAEEKLRAEAAALTYVCGDAPKISPWDGELVGSESFLARNAHDPDSIDVEHCTTPVLTKKACWVSRCQVRGRNAFGALVLNAMIFSAGRAGILAADYVR